MSEHKYKEAWAKGVEDGRKMQMLEDCFNCTFDCPTNGDILMHLFPDTTVTYHPQYNLADSYVTVSIKGCDTVQDYSLAFWDAPFTPNLKLKNEGNTISFPKYKGCKNCINQISPLRQCEWAESGGDGRLHIICPRWRKKGE